MKYILKEIKEDDPIFKQGFSISSHNRRQADFIEIPKVESRKEKIKNLINSLINFHGNFKE